jgi:hypothetical protein
MAFVAGSILTILVIVSRRHPHCPFAGRDLRRPVRRALHCDRRDDLLRGGIDANDRAVVGHDPEAVEAVGHAVRRREGDPSHHFRRVRRPWCRTSDRQGWVRPPPGVPPSTSPPMGQADRMRPLASRSSGPRRPRPPSFAASARQPRRAALARGRPTPGRLSARRAGGLRCQPASPHRANHAAPAPPPEP